MKYLDWFTSSGCFSVWESATVRLNQYYVHPNLVILLDGKSEIGTYVFETLKAFKYDPILIQAPGASGDKVTFKIYFTEMNTL